MAAQHGHGLTRGEWEKSTSFPTLSPAKHRADAHTCAASCARLGAAQEKPVPAACDSVGTGSHWRAAGLATEGSHQRCKHRVRPRCHAHGGQSPLPPGWAAGACTPWRWPRALCRQPPLGAHGVWVMNRAHGGRASLLTPAVTLWGVGVPAHFPEQPAAVQGLRCAVWAPGVLGGRRTSARFPGSVVASEAFSKPVGCTGQWSTTPTGLAGERTADPKRVPSRCRAWLRLCPGLLSR